MPSIRRRKGGRSCFTGARRDIAEVKGGGVTVIQRDALPYVRGRERGATVAARVGER
jgi:hypothetical protein